MLELAVNCFWIRGKLRHKQLSEKFRRLAGLKIQIKHGRIFFKRLYRVVEKPTGEWVYVKIYNVLGKKKVILQPYLS